MKDPSFNAPLKTATPPWSKGKVKNELEIGDIIFIIAVWREHVCMHTPASTFLKDLSNIQNKRPCQSLWWKENLSDLQSSTRGGPRKAADEEHHHIFIISLFLSRKPPQKNLRRLQQPEKQTNKLTNNMRKKDKVKQEMKKKLGEEIRNLGEN